MESVVTWPLLLAVSYLVVYISLYLGCRICTVTAATSGKVAVASLLPAVAFTVFCNLAILSNWDGLQYLPATIYLLPYFLAGALPAMLLGAPWFLRPGTIGTWSRAWGAAALGGLLLAGLAFLALIALMPQLESARRAKSLRVAAAMAAQFSLPVPAGSLLLQTDSLTRRLLKQRLAHRAASRSDADWTEAWPCNERLALYSNTEPPQLVKELAGALAKAGYTVLSGTFALSPTVDVKSLPEELRPKAELWVAGAKPGIFVVYRCNYVGAVISGDAVFNGTNGRLLIWRDFAKEMETVCAAETKAP